VRLPDVDVVLGDGCFEGGRKVVQAVLCPRHGCRSRCLRILLHQLGRQLCATVQVMVAQVSSRSCRGGVRNSRSVLLSGRLVEVPHHLR